LDTLDGRNLCTRDGGQLNNINKTGKIAMSPSGQNHNRLSKKLGGMLLFVALVICLMPLSAEAEENSPRDVEELKKTCRGLGPFNNLDELLYQFYINLDSDCLFYMPVGELEKIWGIKILSEERGKYGEEYFKVRNSADFHFKPYESENDSFYLVVRHGSPDLAKNAFSIQITREYYERTGTLFPYAKFPRTLPEPVEERLKWNANDPGLEPWQRRKLRGRYFPEYFFYTWPNSDGSHEIGLGEEYGVTRIGIH